MKGAFGGEGERGRTKAWERNKNDRLLLSVMAGYLEVCRKAVRGMNRF